MIKDVSLIESFIDELLKNFNIDYLDFLVIYGINIWEYLEIICNGIGVFNKVLSDGWVKYIGFLIYGFLEVILVVINIDIFEFVNLYYYYFF